MKIGELDMHCGECKVIDYCTEPYETPALCRISCLADVFEEKYIQLAEEISSDQIDEKQRQYEENGVGWSDEDKGAICDIVLEKLYAASEARR
jgi:hypothetical protein